jgi:hypothetical protein
MIEFLILLFTVGAASTASDKRDNVEDKSLENVKNTEPKYRIPEVNYLNRPNNSRTFSWLESGYDHYRQVSWTRENTLNIKNS